MEQECSHSWAKYPAINNKKLSPIEMAAIGMFRWEYQEFCMKCGIPKEEQEEHNAQR